MKTTQPQVKKGIIVTPFSMLSAFVGKRAKVHKPTRAMKNGTEYNRRNQDWRRED